VVRIVESPDPRSTLHAGRGGRYVLRRRSLQARHTQRGSGGEIQLTDAIARRVPQREVIVRRFTEHASIADRSGFLARISRWAKGRADRLTGTPKTTGGGLCARLPAVSSGLGVGYISITPPSRASMKQRTTRACAR